MRLCNLAIVENDASETERFLDLAISGDAEAFGELCRLYQTRVFRQAMLLSGNVNTAEELAQETLVEAWKALGRFKGGCQFFTWLCAILLNRYRNSVRARRLITFSDLAHSGPDAVQAPMDTAAGIAPDELIAQEERQRLVRECLEALPGKQQQVIYLRFFTGESLEGIAAALGCSVGTVKSRLFYAMERLRSMSQLSGENMLKMP